MTLDKIYISVRIIMLFHNPYAAKLESRSDDLGCMRRTCVDAKLDFSFLDNLNFFLSHS